MSIRMIAKELYNIQRQLNAMEKEYESASPERKTELQKEIERLRAEKERVRRILEANKTPPPYRMPR